ncbi:MAG TPA: response regulator [Tenuifilaceae bacterium]|jgi:CheY-like chemotaxis protein|nr:response regulator [Tenuifilaceae bacterium]HNY09317.1 response regulator [Tenuifilaceae bacterium]HOA10183.1 response regulator [Tenuifilaceae bacterium]HOW21703.1 response regulator [Tenuifilaceae bacterium]HPS05322.1 response regulator [Tenuifilaceae bacterium]
MMIPHDSKTPLLQGKKILIIEDDTVSRIFLSELLQSTHAEVDFVRSAYEAKKYLDTHQEPNAILLDLRLPDMDGFELAAAIHRQHGDVCIIAQTAYVVEGIDEKCRQSGIDAHIYKPIRRDNLLDLLGQYVK